MKYLAAIGFLVASIPLFIAVRQAASAVEQVADLGHHAIYQVLVQAKTARQLIQRVNDIERKARFFTLLSDPSLRDPYDRESYENARSLFRQSLDGVRDLTQTDEVLKQIDALIAKESRIYETVVSMEGQVLNPQEVDDAFRDLHDAADDLRRALSMQMDQEVGRLQAQSGSVQRGLVVSSTLLVPISLVLIIALLTLFMGTIHKLDNAIRRLGTGDFAQPIRVSGPLDLRYLGERLDWLRGHLLELERSKQRFLRNVSHDIKTPLSTISEGSELLLEGIIGELPAVKRGQAMAVIGGCQRLEALIEELIRYGQLTADSMQGEREMVNFVDLVKSVLLQYHGTIERKQLVVKELLQAVVIQGVPEQLRTLLESLISNAVRFSPPGGEIRVILRTAGENLELEVEDDGPGIDDSERERVFEPFFRGQAGREAKEQGTGVGLAIASECVAGHQGSIEVLEPRQDKRGARLRVHIPLPKKTA